MRQPIRNTPLLPGSLKNLFFPPEKEEYTYFARARECPFAAGDSVLKGAWASDASMLAYARYGAKPMSAADFQENLARGGLRCLNQIGDWNGSGTQGYFAANDQFAILAFRGTEADDPVDVMDDADLLLVPELDHRPDGTRVFPLRFLHSCIKDLSAHSIEYGMTCASASRITARVIPMRKSVLRVIAWVRLWLCSRPADSRMGIFRSTPMGAHGLAIRHSATGFLRTRARRRSGS